MHADTNGRVKNSCQWWAHEVQLCMKSAQALSSAPLAAGPGSLGVPWADGAHQPHHSPTLCQGGLCTASLSPGWSTGSWDLHFLKLCQLPWLLWLLGDASDHYGFWTGTNAHTSHSIPLYRFPIYLCNIFTAILICCSVSTSAHISIP